MKLTQDQPLVKVEVPIPYIYQLRYDTEFGKGVTGRDIIQRLLSEYKDTRADLGTLNTKAREGPIQGSNIYYRFAVGNIVRELSGQDILPINPIESEIALANNTLTDHTKTYEDTGLVVYPKEGYNPVLWKRLREIAQSKEFRDYITKERINLKLPFVATGLMNVVKDYEFEYNLRLDPNEHTLFYNVPILTQGDGKFSSEDPEL